MNSSCLDREGQERHSFFEETHLLGHQRRIGCRERIASPQAFDAKLKKLIEMGMSQLDIVCASGELDNTLLKVCVNIFFDALSEQQVFKRKERPIACGRLCAARRLTDGRRNAKRLL